MPLGAFKAALMGTAGVSTGDVVLLSSQTASGSASLTFSSGITSTYGEYIFRFYNINPATDQADLVFGVNATDGADYNDSAITSTFWRAAHSEDDSTTAALGYDDGFDQAQGTAYQFISIELGNGSDESTSGELHLFNPSSTTYVKHFCSEFNAYEYRSQSRNFFAAGYINDTTAIDDIQFKMDSGNFDGTIKMWGVK
jgi:hypothetical protein